VTREVLLYECTVRMKRGEGVRKDHNQSTRASTASGRAARTPTVRVEAAPSGTLVPEGSELLAPLEPDGRTDDEVLAPVPLRRTALRW
jgi:hypothetical protein